MPAERDDSIRLLAFLSALCLFMSTLEYAIPKPLPFLRIGLANAPILLAFGKLPPRRIVQLSALKALLQGFVSGTFLSYVFVFSAAGTAAACGAMLFVAWIGGDRVSRVGISLGGALASNAVQLLLSRLFLFGAGTAYLAPIVFGLGIVSSLLLGAVAEQAATQSLWYRSLGVEP